MSRPPVDFIAVSAAGLALLMIVVYLEIMRQEPDRPVAWFLAALAVGAGAAGYAAYTGAPHRGVVLVMAGVVLLGSGLLAILSIGFPILVAGALCLLAAARSDQLGSTSPR